MSSTDQLPEGPLSWLSSMCPEIGPIVDEIHKDLDDPVNGRIPVGLLNHIRGILGEYDPRYELEQYSPPEEAEPDPGLFPEDSGFDFATFATSGASATRLYDSQGSSAYLKSVINGGHVSQKLTQEPSMKQTESFKKSPVSDVATVAEEPEKEPRWLRRRLAPRKKTVDREPKRLGPGGTWINDPEAEERERTQTPTQTLTQRGGAVTPLRRQDTLTD